MAIVFLLLFLPFSPYSCSIEPSLTPGGNLELVITSFTNSSSDRCHCYNVTINMIAAINRSIGTGGGGRRRRRETTDTVSVPPSYQYLLQVSQAEIEAGNTTNGTGGNNNNNNNNTTNGTNPTTGNVHYFVLAVLLLFPCWYKTNKMYTKLTLHKFGQLECTI